MYLSKSNLTDLYLKYMMHVCVLYRWRSWCCVWRWWTWSSLRFWFSSFTERNRIGNTDHWPSIILSIIQPFLEISASSSVISKYAQCLLTEGFLSDLNRIKEVKKQKCSVCDSRCWNDHDLFLLLSFFWLNRNRSSVLRTSRRTFQRNDWRTEDENHLPFKRDS